MIFGKDIVLKNV